MGNGLRKQNGQQVGAQRATQAVQGPPGPAPAVPSAFILPGSGVLARGSQGSWWPLEEEEGEEEGTVPPLPCVGGADEVSCVRPRGESPQGAPDLALPSAQCHGATWNKAGLPLCGAKAEEGGTRTPRDLGDGGHSDTLWGFTMHHVAKFTGTLVTYTYQSSTPEAEAGGLP